MVSGECQYEMEFTECKIMKDLNLGNEEIRVPFFNVSLKCHTAVLAGRRNCQKNFTVLRNRICNTIM